MWCAWIAPGTRRRDGGRRTRMTSLMLEEALRRRGGEPSTGRARRLPAGAWPAPAGGRSEPGADRRARQLRPCRQLLRLPGHAARRLAGGLAAHVGSDPEPLAAACRRAGRLRFLAVRTEPRSRGQPAHPARTRRPGHRPGECRRFAAGSRQRIRRAALRRHRAQRRSDQELHRHAQRQRPPARPLAARHALLAAGRAWRPGWSRPPGSTGRRPSRPCATASG